MFCKKLKDKKINTLWEDKVKRQIALDRKFEAEIVNILRSMN